MTNWAVDLDGVVWLGDQPIAGSVEAVHALLERGDSVVFVSNNSSLTEGEYRTKLARLGMPAEPGLVTSAMAAASLVEPGERVLVCGGPGVTEAATGRGAIALANDRDHDDVDVVVVGFHREFNYERLRRASAAVCRGARLVATNDDATYPTTEGPIPGGGAILASVATAAGVQGVVAGKPYPPIVALVHERYGSEGTMVGDRPDTDGRFARALGWEFVLVLSGVTLQAEGADPAPDLVAADLATVVGGGATAVLAPSR
ncbi:MAG: HAD-IIA family hydrolase [Acidimicrobiales bacterium]